MNISNDTFTILKNFATINSNIRLQPGKVLKTLSPSRNIYAEAVIDEEFPQEVGIYDLGQFLSTVSLFKSGDFNFNDDYVTIKGTDTTSSINYYYCDLSLLTAVPKTFKLPSCEVEFDLPSKLLAELQKVSSVLQLPDLCVYSEGNGVFLKLTDKKNDTSNNYEVKLLDSCSLNFSVYFDINNFKLIPGNYKVKLSSKNVSEFTHDSNKIKYYICTEVDSKWN